MMADFSFLNKLSINHSILNILFISLEMFSVQIPNCKSVFHLQDCEFDPFKYNSVIECEKPNNDLNRFRGYM